MPESNRDLYQQKLNRIDDAVQLKKPNQVPIILESAGLTALIFTKLKML